MTLHRIPCLTVVLMSSCFWMGPARAGSATTLDDGEIGQILIHANQGKHRIAPEIYGHFAEHLGRCVYEGFWVGPDSDIPNVRGIRTDVVEALKKMKVPVLRWPGGCFADEYHWKEGVGSPEARGKMINTHWGRVIDDHAFGTHEFMDLCEMLESEAYIAGNVGSGTVEEMQDWVEYLTSDKDSDMAHWRRANGRDKPWRVRYFGVGNENWGCGGNMTPEYYGDLYRRFQTYVRNYSGNRIVKVACGPSGPDVHWTDVVMQKVARHTHAIGMHYYVRGSGNWTDKGSATQFDEREWFLLMKNTLGVDDAIVENLRVMDQHDPRHRVAMYVDEWGTWWDEEPGTQGGFLYQQNTLRDAVSAGVFLNIFNQHCERVKMANIAQINNVLQAMILTRGKEMIVTPTYHVFEMYNVHQGATMLPTDVTCAAYENSGVQVPGLVISSSRDAQGVIHVTACNLNPQQDAAFECLLDGHEPSQVSGRVLTHRAMNAHNTFETPEVLKPETLEGLAVDGRTIKGTIPAKSVVVLTVR